MIWSINQQKTQTATLLGDENKINNVEQTALSTALNNSAQSVPQDKVVTNNLASQISKQVTSSTSGTSSSATTLKNTSTSTIHQTTAPATTQKTAPVQKAAITFTTTQTTTSQPSATELNMANALKQASGK